MTQNVSIDDMSADTLRATVTHQPRRLAVSVADRRLNTATSQTLPVTI